MQEAKNIAESLGELLPKATILRESHEPTGRDLLLHFAVPAGQKLETFDSEKLLAAPRRAKGSADFDDAASFIAYVNRHKTASTIVWANFNPQTFSLAFKAVLNDFGPSADPGWRDHIATYTPKTSAEWSVWQDQSGGALTQLAFAEFLEENADDINGDGGTFPTSLSMLEMATNFVSTSDKAIKSIVRLNSGGANLVYKDDTAEETLTHMKAFDKFRIGIPVFWSEKGYFIEARLKWRQKGSELTFFYTLIRPDRAHEVASVELIKKVRDGIGETQLLLGKF